MTANVIVGNDGANSLVGGRGRDVIYGFDPNGPQSQVNSISTTRVASGLTTPLVMGKIANESGRALSVLVNPYSNDEILSDLAHWLRPAFSRTKALSDEIESSIELRHPTGFRE
jgi:hypothetical protein